MRRGIPLGALLPRLFVVLLLLFGCFTAYKWGQFSRQNVRNRNLLNKLDNLGHDDVELDIGLIKHERPEDDEFDNKPWVETLSWSPRVFLFHNFISEEDCDHIIDLGKNSLTRSEVVGTTGKAVQHEARSSSGTALMGEMANDPVVKRLQKRIADWTQIPESHGEWFYLIRYEVGQQYKPHNDYFSEDANGAPFIGEWGNRMATVLTYLSTPEEGGETTFPNANLKVKAKKGDAVLFFNMNPDGTVDPMSLHGGLPVIRGVKWAMTKWIRQKPFY